MWGPWFQRRSRWRCPAKGRAVPPVGTARVGWCATCNTGNVHRVGLMTRVAVDPIGRYLKLADTDENSADERGTPAEYRRRVRTLRKYAIARTMLWAAILGAQSACPPPYATATRHTGSRRPVNA